MIHNYKIIQGVSVVVEPITIEVDYLLKPNGIVMKDAFVVIEDGKYSYVGPKEEANVPRGSTKLQYHKTIATPAMINSHTHLPETLIRGISDDQDLHTWLYDHVWKVEPFMTKEDAEIGTLLGAAELLASGSIGFVDQFYFSNEIAQVVKETGLKALLAPSIFDGNAETKTVERAFAKNIEVLKAWNGYDNRIFVGFGPHAPYTLEEEDFTKIIEFANAHDTFIHTHVNETEKEVDEFKKIHGSSPLEYLNDMGVLHRVLAAHCVHLTDREITMLKKNKTTVLHNIQSNLKLGSGIAPIPSYIEEGINVVLGTDGCASNNNLSVMEEIKLVSLLFKGLNNNPKLIPARTAFAMATSNAGEIFPNGSYTGKIEEGHPADLTLIDLSKPHNTPIIDAFSNVVYSSNGSDVACTIANGKILYQDNEFLTLDIDVIQDRAQHAIERMMQEADY